MWPNVKIVTRVTSFSHQVWHFQTPNMMFGVSNHLTLNHTSFSQLQSPSVVFENTKVSIDFGVWNDSKSPDMGDRWFAGVLNQHKVRIWQNKSQIFDWRMRLWSNSEIAIYTQQMRRGHAAEYRPPRRNLHTEWPWRLHRAEQSCWAIYPSW